MNRKLMVSALGALMLASSGVVFAEGWSAGAIERSAREVHGERNWGDSDRRDWDRGHRDWRGDGHHRGPSHYRGHKHRGHGDYRGHGHYKRDWHHHYRHDHYRHGWQPRHYDRDGVTIIFRGSFY